MDLISSRVPASIEAVRLAEAIISPAMTLGHSVGSHLGDL